MFGKKKTKKLVLHSVEDRHQFSMESSVRNEVQISA